MRLKRVIRFTPVLCAVLLTGCVSKQKEAASLPDQGKVLSESERLEDYLNSLDIYMELKDSVFTIGNVDMLEIDIMNNSDYQLRTGSKYEIKYFNSEFWEVVKGLEGVIWLDSDVLSVQPRNKASYNEGIHYTKSNFKPGRHRIEKVFSIHIPNIESSTNYHITLSDEFVILPKH